MKFVLPLLLLVGCDPYGSWRRTEVFPWQYTPVADLQPYEEVRWETETWDPFEDGATLLNYGIKALEHRKSAPVEELLHFGDMRPTLPPLGSGVRIDFVGDVMWLGRNQSEFAIPVEGVLNGDLRVGNLETPTAPSFPTELDDLRDIDTFVFNEDPAILDNLPLDVLQLNNNHSVDMGDAGLEETIAEVEAREIVHTGVDNHVLVNVDGTVVALLSFTWGLNGRTSEEHELFVVPFGRMDGPVDLGIVGTQIDAARGAGAQAVIVLLHWGYEYEYYPDPHFMKLARRVVGLGADVIVGHGPHVVQPAELCLVNVPNHSPGAGRCAVRTADDIPRAAAVFYSLGDFGAQPSLTSLQHKVGIVGSVTLDPVLTGMSWTPVAQIEAEAGPELHPLDDLLGGEHDAEGELTAESARLDVLLGSSWRR